MELNERQKLILDTIIREYIDTANPVGSSSLVQKYNVGVSSATARNEMSALEEAGYIAQPHTSAGRIPTEKAYRLFSEDLKIKKIKNQEAREIQSAFDFSEANFKIVSKLLAGFSESAVFWAFHKNSLYYTGISNFLTQPEFSGGDKIYDISLIIDQMDEVITKIFDHISDEPQILLGQENPFSPMCSTVITKYRHNGVSGLFGILSPLRNNYENNLSLINFIKNLF